MPKQVNIYNQSSKKEKHWTKRKFENPKATIRLGTLFSGIGAVEHALQRLKLKTEIVFAGDIDPFVKEAYFANYDIDEKRWHDDVTDFSKIAKRFKYKVDLLVGGSPCQSFSMAGRRGGLEDTRGTLFYDFAKVIAECRPKVFIFENVKGLLSHDKGDTWKIIQRTFDQLGYSYFPEVLNSKHYGIPQSRNRVFVVGFRKKTAHFNFPEEIELNTTMQDFLEDHIASNYYMKEKGVKFVTSIKNQHKHYTQVNGQIALCQKAKQQTNWHGDFIFEEVEEKLKYDEFIFDINKVEDKYYLSETVKDYVLSSGSKNYNVAPGTDPKIARALLQTMHKMHRSGVDNYVSKKGKIRRLTPRECLRLMGFRDSFKIVTSDLQAYRQAGNSIVVDVLIALLKQIDITKFIKT